MSPYGRRYLPWADFTDGGFCLWEIFWPDLIEPCFADWIEDVFRMSL